MWRPARNYSRTVFNLGETEVGAALNHDHSVAYVLRVSARLDSRDELRNRFLTDGSSWVGMREAVRNRFTQKRNALTDDLLDASELEWTREADVEFEE